jgi:hypothetical protein
MINCLEREQDDYAGVAIGARLSTLATLLVIEPRLDSLLVEPEGNASAIH